MPGRIIATVAVMYCWLHRLGRTSGSTRQERRALLPGDHVVPKPHFVTDHAVTIDAPPDAVWPWLLQMGWHRGGWYTAGWVDEFLFASNLPAAERIHPEWQRLAEGDHVPDGPPESECYFVVEAVEPNRHLILHSRSHLPPGFRDRYGAWLEWTWAFVLHDLGNGRTRFRFRSRVRLGPRWLAALYWLALVPADHVMARQMLAGVKRRAESGPQGDAPGSLWRRVAETAGAIVLMVVSPLMRRRHLRWGATSAEVSASMPGDELLPGAQFVATRAITIDAPPGDVWPWIPQVGFGRAGFYSYDLLDNLGRPSARTVLEEWQRMEPGDMVAPMAEPATPATAFTVTSIERPSAMVWSKPDSTWAWKLEPDSENRTRLVTRLKVRYRLRPDALFTVPLMELGDFAMMRRMLRGIKERAEQTPSSRDNHPQPIDCCAVGDDRMHHH